jgi:hypothetical protein
LPPFAQHPAKYPKGEGDAELLEDVIPSEGLTDEIRHSFDYRAGRAQRKPVLVSPKLGSP